MNSLTKQVTELTSSDTLSRIRDNYSQALNTAAHEHRQALLSVQNEAETYREKLEEKVDSILLSIGCTMKILYLNIFTFRMMSSLNLSNKSVS